MIDHFSQHQCQTCGRWCDPDDMDENWDCLECATGVDPESPDEDEA